jgi:acetyltransferase-like isoleucine patch superfamily enzyme
MTKIFIRLFVSILRSRGAVIGKKTIIAPGLDWLVVPLRNVYVGANSIIGRRAWIQCTGEVDSKVTIGDRCSIGRDVVISSASSVSIGNDCLLSYRVTIVDHDHYFKLGESPVGYRTDHSSAVVIGNRTFIGANSTILKGVVIGEDTIIGANSVVTESFPKNSIVAGNPAKVIKLRN